MMRQLRQLRPRFQRPLRLAGALCVALGLFGCTSANPAETGSRGTGQPGATSDSGSRWLDPADPIGAIPVETAPDTRTWGDGSTWDDGPTSIARPAARPGDDPGWTTLPNQPGSLPAPPVQRTPPPPPPPPLR